MDFGYWGAVAAVAAAVTAAINGGTKLMPRGRNNVKPETVSAAEYPDWFARYSEAQENGKGAMTWLEEYEAEDLKALYLRVLADGGAIFTTLTRDGGAISLTIMFGEQKKRFYAASCEELDIILSKMR